MPLIRLTVPEYLPDNLTNALAQAVHSALVTCCKVPENDRFILVQRLPGSGFMLDPHFPNVQRSRNTCIVEVTLLAGRTHAQKAALYEQTVRAATAAGFRPDDILISLIENGAMDWSLGLGVAYGAEGKH